MNSKDLEKELFPLVIQTHDNTGTFGWYTYVRVQHLETGKWYLQRWTWNMQYGPAMSEADKEHQRAGDYIELLQRLIKDVYRSILFSKPDVNLRTESGDLVFWLDENQESESERMMSIV